MIRDAKPAVLLPTVTLSDSAPIAAWRGQQAAAAQHGLRTTYFLQPIAPVKNSLKSDPPTGPPPHPRPKAYPPQRWPAP